MSAKTTKQKEFLPLVGCWFSANPEGIRSADFSPLQRTKPLINTPLYRGVRGGGGFGNRFNGFPRAGKTVETVFRATPSTVTPLKQGVKERGNPVGIEFAGHGVPSIASYRKLTIEFGMAANPDPNPVIAIPAGDCAVVLGDADRPAARIGAQPFQSQARVGRILAKPCVGLTGRDPNRWRQLAIKLPKFWGAARSHGAPPKSLSLISAKALGFSRNLASTWSSKAVRAGRGRGSFMIRSHAASPSNSGKREGKSRSNCSRLAGERLRMASSIS